MEIATRVCFIQQSVQLNEDSLHDLQSVEEGHINNQSIPFAYDDVPTNVSYSKSEYEDQYDQDLDIKNEAQAYPNPNPTNAPNPRPK